MGTAGAGCVDRSPQLAWAGFPALRTSSITGTFSYQSGKNVETSRIAHLVDGGAEFEKLEALDGSPRRLCAQRRGAVLSADQKLVIVDQSAARRGFQRGCRRRRNPLAENHRIRKGEVVRIAGSKASRSSLEPRTTCASGTSSGLM